MFYNIRNTYVLTRSKKQITVTKENPFNSTLETPWAASKMPFQSEKPKQKTKTH